MGLFDDPDGKVEYTDAYGTVMVGSIDAAGVPRASDGGPLISSPCPDRRTMDDANVGLAGGCIKGRVPGKRAGTTKACPTCKGRGRLLERYTRATSHDVLESTFGLEKWRQRLVLIGLKRDERLREALHYVEEDDKSELGVIAETAFATGDGYVKAHKGTDLHRLSEYVDKGWPFPASLRSDNGDEVPVSLQDRADMAAWVRVRDQWFPDGFSHIEQFVVVDELKVAGTADRVSWHLGPGNRFCEQCETPCNIVDLKTGRLDFGAGKIAQQLAIYAHGALYDPQTTQRTPLDVCPHVGLVVNIRPGEGVATVHEVDLVAGWEAVQLSVTVRQYRRAAQSMMKEVGK